MATQRQYERIRPILKPQFVAINADVTPVEHEPGGLSHRHTPDVRDFAIVLTVHYHDTVTRLASCNCVTISAHSASVCDTSGMV